MSDYRDRNDSLTRNTAYEPAYRGTHSGWGWIAAAAFLVIVLAIAFGVRHEPNRVALNSSTPPAATHMTPPAGPLNPSPAAKPSFIPPLAPAPAPHQP